MALKGGAFTLLNPLLGTVYFGIELLHCHAGVIRMLWEGKLSQMFCSPFYKAFIVCDFFWFSHNSYI